MKPLPVLAAALTVNIAFITTAFSQSSPKEQVEALRKQVEISHKDIDWMAFDTTSAIPADSINAGSIQGVWKAYNGIFRFEGKVNTMTLTTPLTIEFKDDQLRHGPQSAYKKYTLAGNYISSDDDGFHVVINKITGRLLVLTLIRGANYTRYYYER